MSKNSLVVFLHLTTPSMTVDVRVENIVAENASGSGVELNFAARNAYEQLQIAMKFFCMVYEGPFQRLWEALW